MINPRGMMKCSIFSYIPFLYMIYLSILMYTENDFFSAFYSSFCFRVDRSHLPYPSLPSKAPLSWYLKETLVLGIYLSLFAYMLGFDVFGVVGVFGSTSSSSSSLSSLSSIEKMGRFRAVVAFLAGAMLQAFSFCTLHDASHYGLLFKVRVFFFVSVGRQNKLVTTHTLGYGSIGGRKYLIRFVRENKLQIMCRFYIDTPHEHKCETL